MKLILNIGLDVNATQTLPVGAVQSALVAANISWSNHKVVQSDTEPTLVVEADVDLWWKLERLSRTLRQDCIAVYNPNNGKGALVGDRAAEWGPFNPELFFLLDGTRLAQPAAKAA